MSRSIQLHYIPVPVFIDRYIFRLNFLGMRLPWECHDQSQETNLMSLCHWSTAFLSQKKRYTENRSVFINCAQVAQLVEHWIVMQEVVSISQGLKITEEKLLPL